MGSAVPVIGSRRWRGGGARPECLGGFMGPAVQVIGSRRWSGGGARPECLDVGPGLSTSAPGMACALPNA
jgi:hypothetical protein